MTANVACRSPNETHESNSLNGDPDDTPGQPVGRNWRKIAISLIDPPRLGVLSVMA